MNIVHLTASPFFGGPERQMLGLASTLPASYRSIFLSFPERGLAQPFLKELRHSGFTAIALENNSPHVIAAAREIARYLQQFNADILCCHGYKSDIIGWLAARYIGIPVLSISRGWTGATRKVRLNENLNRLMLRFMDRVICVSQGQAEKVLRTKIPRQRVQVIRNAIRAERFDQPDAGYREKLREYFAWAPARIVCAAGRLSPEKGFNYLIEAAQLVARQNKAIAFLVFGEGPLHAPLQAQIDRAGLSKNFILAGFRNDIDQFFPHADLVVLPSLTEGLPNVALEALAAGVPVVATAVGGTPEVIDDQVCGYLVPPAQPNALAMRILDTVASEPARLAMGQRGRERIRNLFTFNSQSQQYQRLFDEFAPAQHAHALGAV